MAENEFEEMAIKAVERVRKRGEPNGQKQWKQALAELIAQPDGLLEELEIQALRLGSDWFARLVGAINKERERGNTYRDRATGALMLRARPKDGFLLTVLDN